MKCNRCPALRKTSYEYGEYDCYAGVPEDDMYEDVKGDYGCKLHWKTIRKRVNEHDQNWNISIADGQRLCNPEKYSEVLERANQKKYVERASHCIGLDRKFPYKRNGKLYYRPYRNYYNTKYNDPIWTDLKYLGFAECDKMYWEIKDGKELVNFWLNEDGRKWLADKLGIYKIWEESN